MTKPKREQIEFECCSPTKNYSFWLYSPDVEGEIKVYIQAKNWKEAERLFKNFIKEIKRRKLVFK